MIAFATHAIDLHVTCGHKTCTRDGQCTKHCVEVGGNFTELQPPVAINTTERKMTPTEKIELLKTHPVSVAVQASPKPGAFNPLLYPADTAAAVMASGKFLPAAEDDANRDAGEHSNVGMAADYLNCMISGDTENCVHGTDCDHVVEARNCLNSEMNLRATGTHSLIRFV
jgi:hypothetical protein